MGAPKRVLPPALAANRWRPGQSGNPAGHSGAYGEAMKIARSYAPAAMHRLAELAELNQLDSEGNLVQLNDLPDTDRRVIAVAANSILDRAFGKPRVAEEEKGDMSARLERVSREERLALMEEMLRSIAALYARRARTRGPAIVEAEVGRDRGFGLSRAKGHGCGGPSPQPVGPISLVRS